MKVLSLLSLLILILFLTLMLPCCFWQQIDPYPESSPTILHKFVKLTQQLDGSSSNPSALWDGDSLAVAFEYKDTDGNCFVYFLRCKPDGTLSVTPKPITKNRTVSFKPKLAGNGDSFGIAYEGEDNGSKKIFFRIIDSSGTLLYDEISVSSNRTKSSDPYCVWSDTASVYGIVWCRQEDSKYIVCFAQVNTNGEKIDDPEIFITDSNGNANAQTPSLVWSNSNYALAWADQIIEADNDIYFQSFGTDVIPNEPDPVPVSGNGRRAENPSIAWNETAGEYGIAWHNESAENPEYYNIYFHRVNSSGELNISGEKLVIIDDTIDAKFPALLWNGERNEYTLTWMNAIGTDGTNSFEIQYCYLDSIGDIQEGPYKINNNTISPNIDNSESPLLIWNGEEYTLIWASRQGTMSDIYYAY